MKIYEDCTRHLQVGSTKCLLDQIIDRHAESYLLAYPDIKEFSSFEVSGTFKYYIGMVWTQDTEKPDPSQIRIRGSSSLTRNKLVELDLTAIDSQQTFFPGQVVAFLADPFLKKQIVVKKFLDPAKIAPPTKNITLDSNLKLLVASGPYMKPDQENWGLFDKLIQTIIENGVDYVILMGPFIDIENKPIRDQYEARWRLVFDKLFEGLHQHECYVYIVPSIRDVLPSRLSSNYIYPTPKLNQKQNLKEGVKPKCSVVLTTDPAQIDVGGLYVDVTSADVLFHLNQYTSFINKCSSNVFVTLLRHLVSHGIYPIHPSPAEFPVDFPKLFKYNQIDRLGPHLIVIPTRFNTSVETVDDRLVITVQKCSVKKHCVLVEIPPFDGTSIATSGFSKTIIELVNKDGLVS